MTDLLHFPVIALWPGGVDVYEDEPDLVICHRRMVRATCDGLHLVDQDRDHVVVLEAVLENLPPRTIADGRLRTELVRVSLVLSPAVRLSLAEVREEVEKRLYQSEDSGLAQDRIRRIRDAKSLKQMIAALRPEIPEFPPGHP